LIFGDGRLKDVETRTELYQELVDFLVQKAAQRLKRTEDEIRDNLIKKLFSVAYKCIQSGKLYVEDESEAMD
jgi:hypothetical protein